MVNNILIFRPNKMFGSIQFQVKPSANTFIPKCQWYGSKNRLASKLNWYFTINFDAWDEGENIPNWISLRWNHLILLRSVHDNTGLASQQKQWNKQTNK